MKILIWNIKFFSKNRIVGQTAIDGPADTRADRTKNDRSRALATVSYILGTLFVTDPDIFVVLEPRASAGDPGTLADADSKGPAGLILLLAAIRADTKKPWWLVPPQRINSTRTNEDDPIDPGSKYTECIGVFWREDRVTFTGPWINTAAGPRPSGTAADYTGEWAKVVPSGTKAAGQTLYFNKGAKNFEDRVGFPDIHSRIPFRTTFTEIGGKERLLDLYSVHMDTYERGRAINALTDLPLVDATKTVTVIGGDMNVNVSNMNGYDSTAITQHMSGRGYSTLYPGPEIPILGKPSQYPRTTVIPGSRAEPGAYIGSSTYDWAFIHYADGATSGTPSCALVDRVSGENFTYAMGYPLSAFTRAHNPLSLDTFRGRFNYGKIGEPSKIESSLAVLADGTSDHLPILLTV